VSSNASLRVAAVQMQCSPDGDDDRSRAAGLVGHAADQGATFVVLPELFASLGTGRAMRDAAEPLEGPTVSWARDLARGHGIWLLAGSLVERDGPDLYNTAPLISPEGELVAWYRKIHLFDVEVEGAGTHESDVFRGGDVLVIHSVGAASLGLTTCYDLRFPELFHALATRGVQVVAMPSAFTDATGQPHWEPLVRARAIENQLFVIAPDQCGTSPDGIARHGHSLVVDPWGRVLADAGDDEGVVVVDLDLDEVARTRRAIPNLANRRPQVYGSGSVGAD
jgi:predicted amidohydrolase